MQAARQLLGPGLTPPGGVGGVWATLPYGAHPRATARDAHECHFDGETDGALAATEMVVEHNPR